MIVDLSQPLRFEREIMLKRQREGVAKAKLAGKFNEISDLQANIPYRPRA